MSSSVCYFRLRKPPRPTTEEVSRRLQRAMNKRKKEAIAEGKKPVETVETESDSEEQSQQGEADQFVEQEEGSDQNEERSNDSGCEIEEVKPVRRSKRTPPLRPDPAQLLEILQWMNFTGTRYLHQDTLRELGIKRDVEYLAEMCGLATMMSHRCGAYKEETCQFLSSLAVHFYADEPEVESDGGLGYITFSVKGRTYSLTTNQIDVLFGFSSGRGYAREFHRSELLSLWRMIGDKNPYASRRSKSAQIRSPVIRYLHKAIAHTFFARTVTGNINEGELQFLDEAVRSVIDFTSEGVPLEGDISDTGPTMALLDQFLYYRTYASTMFKKGVKGELSIGGLVTPILVACGIDLLGEEFEPRWIDIPYLTNAGFLDRKRIEGKFAYKFHHPFTNREVLLPLPCVEYTGVRRGRNVDFCPPFEMVYSASDVQTPQPQPYTPAEVSANSSDEFDFEDYDAPRQGVAVKAAHKHIGLLKRWNKYQGKIIKSLKSTVSEMKGQIKELQRKVNGSSSKATRDVGTEPMVIERSRSLVVEARHHFPIDPPRSSSFEPRQYERRSVRFATLVLPGSTSRNEPHVESEAAEGESPTNEPEQHSLPAYTRESMEESVDSFFSHP